MSRWRRFRRCLLRTCRFLTCLRLWIRQAEGMARVQIVFSSRGDVTLDFPDMEAAEEEIMRLFQMSIEAEDRTFLLFGKDHPLRLLNLDHVAYVRVMP